MYSGNVSIGTDLVVQTTFARIPCATFQAKMDEPRWIKRFTRQARPGAYLRVVEPGEVRAGDPVRVLARPAHGSLIAHQAARRCVVAPWRDGGQAQYIEQPVPAAAGTGTEPTRAWARARLGEQVSLEQLARHARMSVRTFTRRFRDETGLSPQKWLLQQRVAHARLLLESTDLSVDLVALRSGLGSATALRQHLQATIGVPPSAYRRTFRQT